MTFGQVRKRLEEAADKKYLDFNSSLVPGETAPMLGVRVPELRVIAKKIAGEDGEGYIRAVSDAQRKGGAYHEELLLHGLVIGYLKCGVQRRQELLDSFVPVIDNWAVCDCSCMTYQFMKKDMEEWFAYLQKYIGSEREYELRFAVVCMLDHFITEDFIGRVLEILGKVRHEGYYAKMAVAWAVSVCFVKFPEETKVFLKDNEMDDFTQNKAIQKIRESCRVSRKDKEELLGWKRKTARVRR